MIGVGMRACRKCHIFRELDVPRGHGRLVDAATEQGL